MHLAKLVTAPSDIFLLTDDDRLGIAVQDVETLKVDEGVDITENTRPR